MSPRKQPPSRRRQNTSAPAGDPRQRGLQAFKAGRFDDAITVLSRIPAPDATIVSVLAEAYARRARTQAQDQARLNDLRRAVELRPHDADYQYHLGLTLHRLGDLDAAIKRYEAVVEHTPTFPGVGLVLALARLEQNPQAGVTALSAQEPHVQAVLAPVQALLRGVAPAVSGDAPLERLWRGLALIPNGDGSARDLLSDDRALPSAVAATVRHYYLGVAAAQAGDLESALEAWLRVRDQQTDTPWLRDNLTAAMVERLSQADDTDIERVAQRAHEVVTMAAGNPALADPLVQALDRGARAAAERGDWVWASVLWQDAREVVRTTPGLGSPRPILHNLALAFEAQEQWAEAAEMWRAMLRTRTRKRDDGAQPDDAHWAWVRKRVIECYKNAGTPGEAVAVFRQAIKAAPDDLDARIQLIDALIANEQEQAASNEVERVLALDPANVDARLRGSALLGMRTEFGRARAMLQPVLAQQPQHEAARHQMVLLLLAEGQRSLQWYDLATAERAFQEAHQYAPTDWRPLINLARVAISRHHLDQVPEMLTRVLELADDQPDVYLGVIECWMVADRIDEVRATMARAEAALPLDADFLIQVGLMLLEHDRPKSPLGLLAPRSPQRTANQGPRSRLAGEVLERALAAEPEDGRLRLMLAMQLLSLDAALALRIAEEGARLLPDDPESFMVLATVLIVNKRPRDAKETLRRGVRLARQQGNTELASHLEEMRRHVGDPMLPMMLQLRTFMDTDDDDIW